MAFITVAIPTFNRLQWLSFTLPAIIEQAMEFPSGYIEIIVSDNCSSDGTLEYLKETAKLVRFLHVNCNEKNIGSEANFYLLPKLATGRYLYVLGDDDLIVPGALRRIVDALQDDTDYLILNYDQYDVTFQKCMQSNSLNIFTDELIMNQESCLERIDAMAMSFLSMWVGRRDFFNNITEEKYRYFASWGMSIQADRYFGITQYPKGKLIATACLRTRQSSDFREENYFLWFLHGSAEVFRYAKEMGVLSNASIRQRKEWLLRRNALQRIRYQRRKGIFNRKETYKLLRADYGELLSFWLLCIPVMYAPGLGLLLRLAWQVRGRPNI